MPDSKITDLTSLTTPANNDVLPIVDVLNDTTKKIAVSSLSLFFNTTVNSNSANWNSVYTNVNSNSGNYILDGGNSKGAALTIGTNNGFDLNLETNGIVRMNIASAGPVTITRDSLSSIAVDHFILQNTTPATSGVAATIIGQQFSPALKFAGNAWNTPTQASSAVEYRVYLQSENRSTLPPVLNLRFDSQIGNAGWFNTMNISRHSSTRTRLILGDGSISLGGDFVNGNPEVYASYGFAANNGYFAHGQWGTKLAHTERFGWVGTLPTVSMFNPLDMILRRGGTNNLTLGPSDYTSSQFLSAQTISVQNAATGNPNAPGAVFTIDGSQSTGNALGGDISFRTANASSTPSNSATQNALNEVFRIKSNRAINFAPINVAPTSPVNGDVYFNSSSNRFRFYDSSAVRWNSINSSRTIETFIATENQPVSANFATLDSRTIDNISVLNFPPLSAREARFVGIIPEGISSGILSDGLLVKIRFSTRTASTSSCRWGAQIKRISSLTYATSAAVDVPITGTAGLTLMNGDITLTQTDSLTEGDTYALRVFRDGTNAADTMTTDTAQLVSVELRTVN